MSPLALCISGWEFPSIVCADLVASGQGLLYYVCPDGNFPSRVCVDRVQQATTSQLVLFSMSGWWLAVQGLCRHCVVRVGSAVESSVR